MTHTFTVWRINTAAVSNVFWEQQHTTWNVALHIKHLATLHPTVIVVLLIIFSFVGATQGFVYCSLLHYCHVANVVAMVWALRHVLWISIIIHSLICTEDITRLHKCHSLSFWGLRQTPESHICNHVSAIDVIWWHEKQSANRKQHELYIHVILRHTNIA